MHVGQNRGSSGWGSCPRFTCIRPNSAQRCSVGTARAISDGVCNAYVIDVWTRSDLRRRGIARRMLAILESRLSGQHVYLFSDDMAEVYRACGYRERPVGMEKVVGTWLQP